MKILIALAIALSLAGCGNDSGTGAYSSKGAKSSTSASVSKSTKPDAAASAGDATVKLADSAFGKIVTTGAGVTLYVFSQDAGGKSACTGGCAQAWPPLTGTVTGSDGIGADDLATIDRPDGAKQVTFYGHPLYRFADDQGPGDTNGQGFGENWFVVDASGNPVKSGSGAAPTTSASSGY